MNSAAVTGSIASDVLTVTVVTSGTLSNGQTISGTLLTVGTRIVEQLTTTETDEALGKKGTYKVSISQTFASGAIVGAAGTSTTYAEGEDYIVNFSLGWVKALSTGLIFEGQPLKVDYVYGAVSGIQIDGGTQTQIRAKFKLDGINFVDSSPSLVTVYDAAISADQAFDFLAEDFNTVSMTGRMKTPVGIISPFNVRQTATT